jgi:hypothetical protein
MNELNEPFVEKISLIQQQLGKLAREREAIYQAAQLHEQWLTACKTGNLEAVYRRLESLPDAMARKR